MPRPLVPDAELAILRALWGDGAATVRDLAQHLYGDAGPSEQATVQKLLERLLERRCVRRRRQGRANVWSAAVAREDLLRDRLRDAADKLCEGSLAPLLTQLVHGAELKRDEIAELRRVLNTLDREAGR
jgi:predicted transcriptional regulator